MTTNSTSTTGPLPALCDVARQHLQAHLAELGENEARNIRRLMLDEVERPVLELMLHHTHGNQSKAAIALGISRTTLRAKLKHHGLA
ncbi:helix-turn-helix domain-containing protein [Candidatus Thiothrix sp. Deng01]|uniref:Putative Fis-like DNA-binding protein n=1 Tax=Candidatus Thiothrix phosphatis TaxID=3112415 RepID=A0ABU6CTG7_9GAMM|nr:helix-turn-helix domain-containing protein [Candidatus Thiothrix sp. Deng01]MEB4590116.1 helix-turn-helix domain-containing protein [Candidatus Thiothrix sp. Deng01]